MSGIVDKIDGKRIVVKATEVKDLYSLQSIYIIYQNLKDQIKPCINQKPLVKVGDVIKKGDIIADVTATKLGELALKKRNCSIYAWQGYNLKTLFYFERCVTDDVFTSIHIEEYESNGSDTKLGAEEITETFQMSEESLRNLDESE